MTKQKYEIGLHLGMCPVKIVDYNDGEYGVLCGEVGVWWILEEYIQDIIEALDTTKKKERLLKEINKLQTELDSIED